MIIVSPRNHSEQALMCSKFEIMKLTNVMMNYFRFLILLHLPQPLCQKQQIYATRGSSLHFASQTKLEPKFLYVGT